jgi:predicted secreted hydrolase
MTAPTPEFQTEWLYYTGNVYTAEAGHSFPLTFFPSGQLRKAA